MKESQEVNLMSMKNKPLVTVLLGTGGSPKGMSTVDMDMVMLRTQTLHLTWKCQSLT